MTRSGEGWLRLIVGHSNAHRYRDYRLRQMAPFARLLWRSLPVAARKDTFTEPRPEGSAALCAWISLMTGCWTTTFASKAAPETSALT